MGQVSTALEPRHREFVAAQRMFFVASAPGGDAGHMNCSPKGLDSFRVLDDRTVAYLDLTGSGIETVAHVRDNGRLCVMFCALLGKPMILRLHGRGDVAESCGFGVPLYDHVGEREQMTDGRDRKGEAGARDFQRDKNGASIDGLAGLSWVERERAEL